VQFTSAPDINAIRQAMARRAMQGRDRGALRPGEPERGADQPARAAGRELARCRAKSRCWMRCTPHYANPIVPSGPRWTWWARRWAISWRSRRCWPLLYSLLGMLVYLWFRFQLIYGVAAVVAVFHDTLITVGVLCADRAGDQPDGDCGHPDAGGLLDERHHRGVRPHPREPAPEPARVAAGRGEPLSINQTLSRTVLTSGLTFLTVLSLYILAGAVLRGFRSRWWWAF
jgi:hypothetical protein